MNKIVLIAVIAAALVVIVIVYSQSQKRKNEQQKELLYAQSLQTQANRQFSILDALGAVGNVLQSSKENTTSNDAA